MTARDLRLLILLVPFVLSSCALLRRLAHPVHAPPEEAALIELPLVQPEEGTSVINGVTLRAVALALEDFLPWDHEPPLGSPPEDACFYQRDSYDVMAWPGDAGVIFVSIYLRPETCDRSPSPLLDVGARYAVDTRGWRILAVQR